MEIGSLASSPQAGRVKVTRLIKDVPECAQSYPAEQQQDEEDDYQQANPTAGILAPVFAVRPKRTVQVGLFYGKFR